MEKRQKGIKWFSWFTWHKLPTPSDYPIKSVLEFVVLVVCLVVLLFIYKNVNKVSIVDDELEIACLDKARKLIDETYDEDTIWGYKFANVIFCLPMTDIKTLKQSVESPFNCEFGRDIMSWHQEPSLMDKKAKSQRDARIAKIFLSLFSEDKRDTGQRGTDYVKHLRDLEVFDSLLLAQYPMDAERLKKYTFYVNNRIRFQNALRHLKLPDFSDSIKLETFNEKPFIAYNRKVYKNKEYLSIKSVCSSCSQIHSPLRWSNNITFKFFNDTIYEFNPFLGDPGWLALQDISQSYFKLKLNSTDIDSIALKIDFVGATEFTGVIPEPDELGMSYILFTDLEKIKKIQDNGLLFHARFIELENRQSVRIFFLTALLGVLSTTLIVFLFFGAYKLIFHWCVSRKSKKLMTKRQP